MADSTTTNTPTATPEEMDNTIAEALEATKDGGESDKDTPTDVEAFIE
ncbi:MAG: hypothetical protein Q4B10_01320 [Actinomycetaceae bacterium]|nr:hypothetical protein [Actinomycetaceae bacterium]